ncbi:hypothetical protein PIB30_003843 [Stylosanthes scabra]|uniref:Uncharacterized protein n=1 Tax=Stylosanthes scabra TaxID=79078 RepID=A0ABU6T5A1_9FABA|nr:hypothetical protein [Stylosanthes scabra]
MWEQNSSSWNEDNSVQSINQSLIISFKHPEEFICRFKAPKLRERIFHFSAESIAKLKAKANKESSSNEISSFKSLSSLAWRCITRARSLPPDRNTSCKLAMNNRTKMEPPLPVEYVGNSIHSVSADSTAGELLEHDLGWAVWKLHLAIVSHTNRVLLEYLNEWLKSPAVYQHAQFFKTDNVMIGCSPRFNMYGNEFGMGKAVVVLSGYVNKFHGKVASYL